MYSLLTVSGTPLEASDVEAAFNGIHGIPDVVIVTLNIARASGSPFAKTTSPLRLMSDSNTNLMASMKRNSVRKIVHMQAHGVGESWASLAFVMKCLVTKSNMAPNYQDHERVAKETEASGLNYVLARPTRLVEGDSLHLKLYGNSGEGIGGFSSITRKSVAVFLVDAAEKSDWDRTAPVISN